MFAALFNQSKKVDNDLFSNSPILAGLQRKVDELKEFTWPEIPLSVGPFVVFDTETTGLSFKKGDEIISIGAVTIRNGEIVDEFYQLVNPNKLIPEQATKITGITNEMVADSSDIITALDNFLEYKGLAPLVAHNASFDLNFINVKLRKYCGKRLYSPIIDTFLLSRLLFPQEEFHSLDHIAGRYNISTNGRHTALGDSIITAQAYIEMASVLKSRGFNTTHQLAKLLQFRRLI